MQVLDLHSKPSTAAVLQGRQLFCWAFPVSEEVLWERLCLACRSCPVLLRSDDGCSPLPLQLQPLKGGSRGGGLHQASSRL